jgi:hypothetical protein
MLFALTAGMSATASAQSYPVKPVHDGLKTFAPVTRLVSGPPLPAGEAGIGLNVDTTTPGEFAAFLDLESDKSGRVIRRCKITADWARRTSGEWMNC